MKKTISILLSFFCFTAAFGQGDFGRVTPQVADFIKYGETPVSLFNGTMSLEVPLYHYRDNDFDIPIRLIYSAEGFKPEKRADFVGMDWTLAAGGCITREVYDVPDEIIADGEAVNGYYQAVKSGGYPKNKVWNFDPSVVRSTADNYEIKPLGISTAWWVDYKPDLFMFNFNMHSGRFMIDDDAVAKAFNRAYKIDVSGFDNNQRTMLKTPNPSVIKITDPNGYVYEFGGDLSKLEFSIHFADKIDMNLHETRPVILAWHLSKITAPNGRTAIFNYVATSNSIHTQIDSPLLQSGKAKFDTNTKAHKGTAVKKAVLESITIDNTIIEFKKSVEKTLETYKYRFFDHNYFNHSIYQLDTITVKTNNQPLYTYKLSYENKYRRRFLTSVQLPVGKYLFEYNHTTYPAPDQPESQDSDHYGFWKNNNMQNSYGLIQKITYPTRGYSVFTYEKHQFVQAVELDITTMNKHIVASSNNSNTHNGARIHKVSSYSNAGVLATEKEYIYKYTITNINSSGILYQSKPYFVVAATKLKTYISNNTWNRNYNIDEPAVGYSSVFERHRDGSYSQYYFFDYNDYPDENHAKLQYISTVTTPDTIALISDGHNRIVSNSDKRGHLKQKTSHTSAGSQKSSEGYEYKWMASDMILQLYNSGQENPVDNRDYVVSFSSIFGGGLARKIYFDKYHPVTTIQNNTDNVTVTEIREYNSYDLPKRIRRTNSTGGEIVTTFKYPFDFTESPYTEMVTKNIVSPVVEQLATHEKDNISVFVEKNRNEYTQDAVITKNLILPYKQQSQKIKNGEWLNSITYDLYDTKGNLLQATRADGLKTVYLWGYKEKYPIAEIVGATYAEVTAIINATTLKTISEKNQPDNNDWDIINALRTNNNLKHAQVSTYTYTLLVGMTTATDLRGVITHYDYDSFGRLKEVYYYEDNVPLLANKRRVESYNYHYKQ